MQKLLLPSPGACTRGTYRLTVPARSHQGLVIAILIIAIRGWLFMPFNRGKLT